MSLRPRAAIRRAGIRTRLRHTSYLRSERGQGAALRGRRLALLAWLLKILAIDRTQAWTFRRLPVESFSRREVPQLATLGNSVLRPIF